MTRGTISSRSGRDDSHTPSAFTLVERWNSKWMFSEEIRLFLHMASWTPGVVTLAVYIWYTTLAYARCEFNQPEKQSIVLSSAEESHDVSDGTEP